MFACNDPFINWIKLRAQKLDKKVTYLPSYLDVLNQSESITNYQTVKNIRHIAMMLCIDLI
jgi:hypothetical protein